MSLLHYFSKDTNKRTKFMFNFVAPIYGKIDGTLRDNYEKLFELLKSEIDINNKTVLDVGTGTGAWAFMFLKNNARKVQGVDIADKMLSLSKEKYPQITFRIGNAEDLKEIKDNTFDIVTASYVIHGVKADRRAKMISEMKRISKHYVVIHDFMGKTPIFARFLEFLEKSDYKKFKKNFCDELKTIFSDTKKIPSDFGTGLYISKK